MTRKLTKKEQQVKDAIDALSLPMPQISSQITWMHRVNPYPGYEEKVYQHPERDEQGTFYGYKVLVFTEGKFYSPRYPVLWNPDGSLEADREPTSHNSHGIYSVKRIDDSEIYYYLTEFYPSRYQYGYNYKYDRFVSVIARLAISGTVIEHETGFRSQSAQILEIFENENRYSYQEVYERSQGYSRRYTEKRNPWNEDYYYDPKFTK